MNNIDSMSKALENSFIALQVIQLVFLGVHDWVPLGRLNDLAAFRRKHSTRQLIGVTLLGFAPVTLSLLLSTLYLRRPYPLWVHIILWVTYGALLIGVARAWWIPYLFREDKSRVERFRAMFANTHAFLPLRNGVVPNTLHVFFHAVLVATLGVLFAMEINS